MKIILAKEIGYCMGVKRAMTLAFKALSSPGRVISHGPLIHNRAALDLMRSKGLLSYDPDMELYPEDTLIIRAHGLPPLEMDKLLNKGVTIVDATCPKVAKIQKLVETEAKGGSSILIYGTAGHPEVEGLLGYAGGMGRVIISPEELPALPDFPKLLLVSQTTRDPEGFSEMKEAVLDRYGERARVINTICEATIKRQREVAELGKVTDAILVVGGKDSGNTKRLKDIGERLGLPTVSAEGPEDIALDFPGKAHSLGVAAGASTPVWQIRVVVQSLLAREREESGSPLRFLSRLLRVLVLSNVYIGMGVASIGRAMGEALGIGYSHFFFGLFFYFGLLMFLLSGLTQADHVRYNDPDRANFFIKYRKSLTCLCVLSGFMALFSANYLGAKINILIAAQMFLGLLCILPWNQFYKPFNILGYRSLKEIPCMQILTRSAGWSILVICPAFLSEPALLSVSYEDLIKAFFGLTLVFLQVFVRTFIMNMQDARGDRVFSPVTPVHFLGPKWSVRFILAVMGFWALVILISYFWGGLNKLVLIFLITGPAYNVLVLRRFFKNNWLGGYQFDLLLDAQFFLTGLAGLLFWLYR